MPRASDTTTPITIYPRKAVARKLARLAKKEKRSVNAQTLTLLDEALEARNGSH